MGGSEKAKDLIYAAFCDLEQYLKLLHWLGVSCELVWMGRKDSVGLLDFCRITSFLSVALLQMAASVLSFFPQKKSALLYSKWLCRKDFTNTLDNIIHICWFVWIIPFPTRCALETPFSWGKMCFLLIQNSIRGERNEFSFYSYVVVHG